MSSVKMTDATSFSRPLSLVMATMLLLFAAGVHAAAPGISGTSFSLTAQPAYLNQPDGLAVYSWGYGCTAQPAAATFKPTMASASPSATPCRFPGRR